MPEVALPLGDESGCEFEFERDGCGVRVESFCCRVAVGIDGELRCSAPSLRFGAGVAALVAVVGVSEFVVAGLASLRENEGAVYEDEVAGWDAGAS